MSRLGLEPRCQLRRRILSPILIAVSVFRPRHYFIPVRCVYQFRQRLIFRNLKKFCWPSPYTLFNLHLYSTNGETRSELRGATSNFRPQFLRTKPHAGLITYNFHPPFRNFLFHQAITITISNVFAIGLLVLWPYLIAVLLRRQRKLPCWWFTRFVTVTS